MYPTWCSHDYYDSPADWGADSSPKVPNFICAKTFEICRRVILLRRYGRQRQATIMRERWNPVGSKIVSSSIEGLGIINDLLCCTPLKEFGGMNVGFPLLPNPPPIPVGGVGILENIPPCGARLAQSAVGQVAHFLRTLSEESTRMTAVLMVEMRAGTRAGTKTE